jgi:hypothetical protein
LDVSKIGIESQRDALDAIREALAEKCDWASEKSAYQDAKELLELD